MALNLYSGDDLKVDGMIGPITYDVFLSWATSREITWTNPNEMFQQLMEIVPIEHGKIQ